MIYSHNYLTYYSGVNRKTIFKTFANFIDCLRRDDMDALSCYLMEDCISNISMTGYSKGKENVCKSLSWPGPKMDITRITFSNFVCRSHKNIAVQSAYTQHLYVIKDENNVYPFTFGGEFNIIYHKCNNEWKIKQILFDLMYESGNNSYVKDFWNLMDYSILYGHLPTINPELESPWIAVPYDDEEQSDVEKIFELEFQNNVGMDGGCFLLCHDIMADDVYLNYSQHKNVSRNYTGNTDGDYFGRKDAINFFRSKQHKEARLQHNVSMAECTIQGNQAKAFMLRSEYHRLHNRVLDKKRIHQQPLSAVHEIEAVKVNGIWKMQRMSYYPIVEFFDLPDYCVCYDEYLENGVHWQRIKRTLGLG